jgi:hypothetical protein
MHPLDTLTRTRTQDVGKSNMTGNRDAYLSPTFCEYSVVESSQAGTGKLFFLRHAWMGTGNEIFAFTFCLDPSRDVILHELGAGALCVKPRQFSPTRQQSGSDPDCYRPKRRDMMF